MASISRITLIKEESSEAPKSAIDEIIPETHTVRLVSVPDGFFHRAADNLDLGVDLLKTVGESPLKVVPLIPAEDREPFLRQFSRSPYWTVYFENTHQGNRYSLLVEFEEDEFVAEHSKQITEKYGMLAGLADKIADRSGGEEKEAPAFNTSKEEKPWRLVPWPRRIAPFSIDQ